MSHNKLTIGTATGNRASSLSLELGDLNDVSSATPTSGEFLSWNGSNWVASPMSGGSTALTAGVVAWVGGFKVNYTIGSNLQPAVGSFYYLALGQSYYRPQYFHDQTNATWHITNGTTAFTSGGIIWCDRVELTAGTYLLRGQHIIEDWQTTNPWVDVQWQTEAGVALSPIRRISSIYNACNILGMIKTTSTVKVGLKIIAKSSTTIQAPSSVGDARLDVTIVEIT